MSAANPIDRLESLIRSLDGAAIREPEFAAVTPRVCTFAVHWILGSFQPSSRRPVRSLKNQGFFVRARPRLLPFNTSP